MNDRLRDYVPVAERLAAATADIESITTSEPVLLAEGMGYIRAVVRLRDGSSATGTASFLLGLSGKSAQATNPLEDAETSAVGRALAFLGYETKRGVASREEVREAQRRASTRDQLISDLRAAYRAAKAAGAEIDPPDRATVDSWTEEQLHNALAAMRAAADEARAAREREMSEIAEATAWYCAPPCGPVYGKSQRGTGHECD